MNRRISTTSKHCVARLLHGGWLVTVMVCLLPDLLPAQTPTSPQRFSHGDPTAEEQYLLEKLNRARRDPTGEGQRLAAWLRDTPAGQGTIAFYHTDPDQVARDFAAFAPAPPVAFEAHLIAAARAHSLDLAPHDGQGPPGTDPHTGWDGSDHVQRAKAAGYPAAVGGEDVAPGGWDLDEIHAGFLVDWGQPNGGLGHRYTRMDGWSGLNVVGIGLATKPAGVGDGQSPLVETEDFGFPGLAVVNEHLTIADAPAYLLGVAYRDNNGNGLYDVGEGIAGVTVTMEGGAFYTVTGESGGYALPLVRADGSYVDGAVAVHMTGLPDGGTQDATLSVDRVALSRGLKGGYRTNVPWDAVVPKRQPGGGSTTPFIAGATLSGGGTVSRAARNAVKVMVNRPAGDDGSAPLDVSLQFKGTAVPGVDYKPLPATVTIPAGARSLKLKVKALGGDNNANAVNLTIKIRKAKGMSGKVQVIFDP